jgi:nitrogen regulatory protein P-II 1
MAGTRVDRAQRETREGTETKLVTAIVRSEKLDELIDAVIDNNGRGLTITQVRGFGRQFGERAARALGADTTAADLPRTGTIGEGKIRVSPVDGATRVRTGEKDRDAV